jgi:hypothetical protein
MLICVAFVYSHFTENPTDMILGDKPLIYEVVLSHHAFLLNLLKFDSLDHVLSELVQ